LGVLDDAEDIIIRAAYKALAQRYHPDKWKGDTKEANQRMSDINEAYTILSDAQKRKEYDKELFKTKSREELNSDDEPFQEFLDEELESWKIAIEFFPDLKNCYIELNKISNILANTFRTNILEKQKFANAFAIKKEYEKEYLIKYYGANEDIRKFAKELLLNGYTKAAIRVNKIVRVMGNSITFPQLMNQIYNEYKEISVFFRTQNDELKLNYLISRLYNKLIVTYDDLEFLFNNLHKNSIELKVNRIQQKNNFEFIENNIKIGLNYEEMVEYIKAKYINSQDNH
jgi:hypothetical protein